MTRLLRRPFAALLALPLALALLFATSSAAQAGTGYTGSSIGPVDWHTDYMAMGCDSMSVAGQRDATGLPATLASSDWRNCILPLGLESEMTQTGTWNFVPASTSGSVTSGTLQGVDFSLVAINPSTGLPDPSLCSFTVQGDALASYDAGTDQFTIDHDQPDAATISNPLSVTYASGCGGVVLAGDAFYLVTTLQLT